jgi:hypothetical protein
VAEEYLVGVTSKPAGLTLFSPRLMLLDAQGILLREVPRDSFLFHGANLHAALRARAGDAYLEVASDPRTIGQRSSQLAGTVQSTYAPVGVGGFMVYTGAESNTVRIFAHNGMIEVTAKPWPKIPDPGSTPTNTGDRPPRGRM